MILETLKTARDLGRLHEIASVLVRHGLGDAVKRLGVARILDRAGRAIHWRAVQGLDRPPEVRVREALEQLGPTFVKLGQILAGRTDLLPPTWTDELSRLHERATPAPFAEVREQLRLDLGADPAEVFAEFDEAPLAAASIAQVHRATLADGTAVALKLRRPGIRPVTEADLRLLARLAEQAEEHVPELRRYRPRNLVRQFARSLRNELDLRVEAKNAERLRASLPADSPIVVPRIHAEWTTERLCVMDFLEGPSIGEWIRAGRPDGVDAPQVAALGAEAMLRAILVEGFFHADPHPGNVVLLPDGRIGLLDFGMVGALSESRRLELLDLFLAVGLRDVDQAVDTLVGWSDGAVDTELLGQECAAFIDRYSGLPLRAVNATEVLGDLTALLRENDLFLPSDVAVLIKVFITLDGLGRLLDPDFVMATHVEPFARRAWSEQRSTAAVLRRGVREVGALLTTLPRGVRDLLLQIRRGRIQVDIDVARLERFGHTIDRSANRVTVGLVTAALIVGTSISLTVAGGPTVLGLPLFGFLGFTSSILAGVWLLWSILRSGRR
jgi:ubiquinone biosynthesis protein